MLSTVGSNFLREVDYKKIIPYVEYLTQKISSIMSENNMIEENPDYIQTDEET